MARSPNEDTPAVYQVQRWIAISAIRYRAVSSIPFVATPGVEVVTVLPQAVSSNPWETATGLDEERVTSSSDPDQQHERLLDR